MSGFGRFIAGFCSENSVWKSPIQIEFHWQLTKKPWLHIFSRKYKLGYKNNKKTIFIVESPLDRLIHKSQLMALESTSLSHVACSTTLFITHLCLDYSFVVHILEQIKYKLIVWGCKRIQTKKLPTTKFNNILSSMTFISIRFPSRSFAKFAF
jgi:hypothetical protein